MAHPLEPWRAEVTVALKDKVAEKPVLLPMGEPVTVGRGEHCGIRLDDPKVSSVLATFSPSEHGWILTNGQRTRVRAKSAFVLDASFAPRAQVLLQPADWTLRWDLDVLVEIIVRMRRGGSTLPVAHDQLPESGKTNAQRVGTDVAGDRLALTPLQRRRLGALFAYLIEGTAKPEQLLQAAALRSGDSIPQITGTFVRIRDYVNRNREWGDPIDSIEDLGYHLVEVAGVLGPDDVPDPGQ